MTDPGSPLGDAAERPATQPAAPNPGGWQRFLDQKTTAQRFLVAASASVAALATIAGGVYGVSRLVDAGGGENAAATSVTTSTDDSGQVAEASTPPQAPTGVHSTVLQGSDEADSLVRSLLEATGETGAGRIPLKHLIYERDGFTPFDSGDIVLLYNCRGQPVGNDHCNHVRLQFPDQTPPDVVNSSDGDAGYFLGTFAVRAPAGQLFGSDFDVQFNNVDR